MKNKRGFNRRDILKAAGLAAGSVLLPRLTGRPRSVSAAINAKDSDSAATALFQSAENAWAARQWKKAASAYRLFLNKFSVHPLAAQAHLRLGTYLSFEANIQSPIAQYQRAIAMAPGTRVAHEAKIGVAALRHARGQYAEAHKLFGEVMGETRDWDLIKYCTYRMKEIDRYRPRGTGDQVVRAEERDITNCGALALAKMFELKERKISLQETAELVRLEAGMASFAALKDAAEKKGLRVIAAKISRRQLGTVEKPLIAHLAPNHFVVVTDVTKEKIAAIDPRHGNIDYSKASFQSKWTGYVLLFPQGQELPDSIALVSEKVLRRIKGGHHLHGNNLGGADENGPTAFDRSGCPRVGLPNTLVNLSNFNFLVQDTDFAYSGRGPRVFLKRTYNADDADEGAFGRSWTSNYEVELVEEPNGDVNIKRESGKQDHFILISCTAGSCAYTPPAWSFDQLVKKSDGTWDLRVKRTRLTQHFNAQGRLTQITDRNGNFVTPQYDANGRLQSVTDAVGRVTTFTYGATGKIIKVTDPAGREATYEYDASNNLIKTVDMAGNLVTYTYDANSYMNSLTTPKGTYQVTNVPYVEPAFGLVVSSIADPLGNSRAYTTPGNVIVQVDDANGNPWQYFIRASDAATTDFTDPLGNKLHLDIDGAGNTTAIKDAKGNQTNLSYDSRGNVLTITNPLQNKVTLTYDNRDNLTSLKDPLLRTYQYVYDAKDHLTKVTDPKSGVTIFTYDSFGQLTSLTDPRNNVTTFTYDNQGNLKTMTTPLGHITSYSYDAIGRLISATTPKGDTINYSYDDIDRLTKINYPDSSVALYTYECCNLKMVSDKNGTLNFVYDKANRMATYADVFGKAIQYGYDKAGNLLSLSYPDGKLVTYEYDKANRLIKVTDWLGNTVTYDYDAAGNLISARTFSGLVTAYQYDKSNRLTALANVKPDGSLLSYYKYTLDVLGNRKTVAAQEPLSLALQPEMVTSSYDPDNQLTSATGKTFVHDNNGNLISETEGANVKTYGYDLNDRLTQVTANGQTTQYQYDGLGYRLSKTVGSSVTRYVLDPNGVLSNVLGETDATGNFTSYYVYGLGLVSKITPNGQTFFHQYDGLGSTMAMTDPSGNVLNKYAYDPFGNLSSNFTETIPNPFRYVGRFGVMDESNGLLYMRARYYSPEVARFISKDPIGLAGGLNMYAYVRNNPVRLIDPTGLYSPNVLDYLTRYGNWGGPHWSGGCWIEKGGLGDRSVEPMDWVDAWWKRHDIDSIDSPGGNTDRVKAGALRELLWRKVFVPWSVTPSQEAAVWAFYFFGHN